MRVARTVLGLLGVVIATACTDETRFTDEERALLAGFRLPTTAPPDPSNAVADDPRAAVLGKQFFFDPRFSGRLNAPNDGVSNGSLGAANVSGKVSCESCHAVAAGGSDQRSRPAATSLGAGYTGRNANTVINSALSDNATGGWQFWDGRKDSLWSQALGPGESAVEHNGTRLQFAHVVFEHYKDDYEAIFGALPDLSDFVRFPADGKPGDPAYDNMSAADRGVIDLIYANWGKAIAAYERRLISQAFAPSPFDSMLAGDDSRMSPSAVRGAKLFIGRAACDECHRGPAFSDLRFHNIGAPQHGENVPTIDRGRSDVIAEILGDSFNRAGAFSDATDDSHLASLVAVEADIGSFRTPTLRNVGKTAPYMHSGVYATLWDVVNHYNFGGGTGVFSGTKEVTIAPLLLDDRELDDLVEFLLSLADGAPLPTPDFPEGLVAAPTLP